MIELLQEYWKPFLYTDGTNITGLAMTLWLLSASIFIGFLVSIPLSIARVSSHFYVRWPVQFYTYLFRGTPLYIQLLICYTGIYSLAAVREQPLLDSFFRDAMNCTILAFALNTCAYTTEIFAGAIRSMNHGEVEAAKALVYQTAWRDAQGQSVVQEVSMIKALCGTLVNEVLYDCLQFHGGMGYLRETPIERMARDARIQAIGGGATEVMLEEVAKRMV